MKFESAYELSEVILDETVFVAYGALNALEDGQLLSIWGIDDIDLVDEAYEIISDLVKMNRHYN
jgi:hypothetical protein